MPGQYYTPTPVNPNFNEWVAPPVGQQILEGAVTGAGSAFAAHAGIKADRANRENVRETAKALLQSFIAEGINPDIAKSWVREFIQQGTMKLEEAYRNRQKVAAEIKKMEAEGYQAQATGTAKLAEGEKDLASARLTDVQAGLAPTESEADIRLKKGQAAQAFGAGAASQSAARLAELDYKLKTVGQKIAPPEPGVYDADGNQVLDADEFRKMVEATFKELTKAAIDEKMNAPGADPTVTPELSEAEKDQLWEVATTRSEQEARRVGMLKSRTPEILSRVSTALRTGKPAPPDATKVNPPLQVGASQGATTYEQAIAQINARTDLTQVQKDFLIQRAKLRFHVM